MAWTETSSLPNPWVSTAGVPPSTWTPTPPCGTTVLVTTQQKTQTLYYIAGSGQTQFPLSAADMFGNNILLTDDTALVVSKGGLRLVPDDGTGAGGYTVDTPGNTITLLWPAGSSEILVVDIYDDTAIGIGPAGPPGAAGADGAVGPQGPAGPPGGIPEAAADGNAYGRVNNAWATVLPTTGGTITGNLTVNQVLTVQGSNSLVLNAPLGGLRAILGMAANIARWSLALGDSTAEGLGNVGANFTLSAYSTTGAFLGNWLTIARADGATVFNGSGVTIAGGLAVNGLLALADLTHLTIYGGSAGQVLTTNGSGVLSWTTPTGGGGGITDAPNDGTAYARESVAWAHLAHTDITDWTATLAPYALTSAVPVASSTTPAMDGSAAVGTGTTWARADHVHPSDTSRYAATNPSGYQTAAQVTASLAPYALTSAVPVASSTTPLMNGVAAIGSGVTWAKADHVHPTDTALLSKSGGTLTGALTPSSTAGIVGTTTNDNANVGAVGEVISSNVTTPVTMTTATGTNITSISLTAGDWDVSGEVWFVIGTGGATQIQGAISAISATNPSASAVGASRTFLAIAFPASTNQNIGVRTCRVSLAATTTYYLVAVVNFPSGTCTAAGNIWARRAR